VKRARIITPGIFAPDNRSAMDIFKTWTLTTNLAPTVTIEVIQNICHFRHGDDLLGTIRVHTIDGLVQAHRVSYLHEAGVKGAAWTFASGAGPILVGNSGVEGPIAVGDISVPSLDTSVCGTECPYFINM
jgi:hypothetical protein